MLPSRSWEFLLVISLKKLRNRQNIGANTREKRLGEKHFSTDCITGYTLYITFLPRMIIQSANQMKITQF